MKVLIVNTFDTGGAANACIRLHIGLLNQGVDSKLLLLNKSKNVDCSYSFERKQLAVNKYFKYLKKLKIKIAQKYNFKFLKEKISPDELFLKERSKNLELFSFPYSIHDITQSKLYKEADIINLHWVAGFLDFESFFKMNTKPVVWTLHDMNPFTGGEHYVETNHGINEEGVPALRVISEMEKLYSSNNLKLKTSSLLKFNDLTIVSPSRWLQEEAEKSQLFRNRKVNLIPYGMDVDLFKIRDKRFSRELFNIPLDKKVVLFVADYIGNNRKGYVYLKQTLELLNREDVILCSIGKGKPELNSEIESIHLGHISDERIISTIYSLADVFVIPSLMDNLPNTVLESLLCGTPVIGFPVGGITDMVEHGKNGLLTSEVNVQSLKETIENFLIQEVSWSRDDIRKQAVLKYDQSIQAKNYIELYTSIINNHKQN